MQLANQNQTPAFFRYFSTVLPAMRIINEVELKLSGKENLIALSIKLAIKNNTPYIKIIQTIKEQATDNYSMISFMLGNKLTNEILNFN